MNKGIEDFESLELVEKTYILNSLFYLFIDFIYVYRM